MGRSEFAIGSHPETRRHCRGALEQFISLKVSIQRDFKVPDLTHVRSGSISPFWDRAPITSDPIRLADRSRADPVCLKGAEKRYLPSAQAMQ
jgi:hypothetical protein